MGASNPTFQDAYHFHKADTLTVKNSTMPSLNKDDAVRYPARLKGTLGLPAFLVGAVYPIVFGATGGGLMHEVHKRSVRREATVPS